MSRGFKSKRLGLSRERLRTAPSPEVSGWGSRKRAIVRTFGRPGRCVVFTASWVLEKGS